MIKTEKRKTPRVPITMNVEHHEKFETFGFGYAKNISEEGVAIDAQALAEPKKVPAVGEQIRMRFKLPKSDIVISVKGEVIRIDDYQPYPQIALSFIDLEEQFRYEIRRYISISLVK